MSRRYSRILSAARYYAAIDNYMNYIKDASRRGAKVGSGKSRPESIGLAIEPFGFKVPASNKISVSATKTAWDTYQSAFAARTVLASAVDGDKLLPKLSGYRAPRVNIITGSTDNGTATTSKVTGLKYLKYNTTSRSVPFGRKDAADTINAAFLDIKKAVGPSARRVYLINEKL